MWRMMGYSLVMPMPPRIWRASRATVKARCTLLRLAMLICAVVARPSLRSTPKRQVSNCALVISVIISASFFWVSWKPAMGLPNWMRSLL
jgi:hypothetical protein